MHLKTVTPSGQGTNYKDPPNRTTSLRTEKIRQTVWKQKKLVSSFSHGTQPRKGISFIQHLRHSTLPMLNLRPLLGPFVWILPLIVLTIHRFPICFNFFVFFPQNPKITINSYIAFYCSLKRDDDGENRSGNGPSKSATVFVPGPGPGAWGSDLFWKGPFSSRSDGHVNRSLVVSTLLDLPPPLRSISSESVNVFQVCFSCFMFYSDLCLVSLDWLLLLFCKWHWTLDGT